MNTSMVNKSSSCPTISSVAGLNVKILSSVKSILPLIDVPNHPIMMLRIMKPATPNCKFLYWGVLWLSVRLLMIKKVAHKKVEISDRK